MPTIEYILESHKKGSKTSFCAAYSILNLEKEEFGDFDLKKLPPEIKSSILWITEEFIKIPDNSIVFRGINPMLNKKIMSENVKFVQEKMRVDMTETLFELV